MSDRTISEITAKYGITRRAIQGYTARGLVSASGKNKYGHLLYSEEMQQKIRLVRQYQDCMFSLDEISAIFSGCDCCKGLQLKKLDDLIEFRKKLDKNIIWLKGILNR